MKDKNLKFGQIHIIIETILIVMMIIYDLYHDTNIMQQGLIIMAILLFVDIVIVEFFLEKKVVINIARIAELLTLSFYMVFNPGEVSVLVVCYMMFVVRMLEIIFLFDYSDVYSRVIAIGIMVLPITLLILMNLILSQKDDAGNYNSIGSIAMVAIAVVIVAKTSEIFTGWLNGIEHKVFEQRRMAEKSNEMNETLRIHQEKVRKANEELSIQKIKMENANRMVLRASVDNKAQNEILKQINTCYDLKSLADKISDTLCNTLEHQVFCCIMLEPLEENLEPVFSAKANSVSDGFMKAFSAAVINRSFDFLSDKRVTIDKILEAPCYSYLTENDNVRSVAVMPLFRDKKPAGIMFCGSDIEDYYDDSINLLENISAQVMLGINNINLYHEIQMMAITDGLTGIYNRRHLNEIMERYKNDAIVNRVPLSVAMIDIDHFKKFNDEYSHSCGDMVLGELAKILKRWAEEYGGIAARYGGEEFIIAIYDCDSERMEECLVGIKEEIDKASYIYDGVRIVIRVSMGYSTYPDIRPLPLDIINRADNAMYYSKENGRNRITRDSEIVDDFIEERGKTAAN